MKKFLLITLSAIFLFVGCSNPVDDSILFKTSDGKTLEYTEEDFSEKSSVTKVKSGLYKGKPYISWSESLKENSWSTYPVKIYEVGTDTIIFENDNVIENWECQWNSSARSGSDFTSNMETFICFEEGHCVQYSFTPERFRFYFGEDKLISVKIGGTTLDCWESDFMDGKTKFELPEFTGPTFKCKVPSNLTYDDFPYHKFIFYPNSGDLEEALFLEDVLYTFDIDSVYDYRYLGFIFYQEGHLYCLVVDKWANWTAYGFKDKQDYYDFFSTDFYLKDTRDGRSIRLRSPYEASLNLKGRDLVAHYTYHIFNEANEEVYSSPVYYGQELEFEDVYGGADTDFLTWTRFLYVWNLVDGVEGPYYFILDTNGEKQQVNPSPYYWIGLDFSEGVNIK